MILNGDSEKVLPELEAGRFDAVITDPPYGLDLNGLAWDHGVPSAAIWREARRTTKPGGHLAAFGGARMFHRLACNIEDAGWTILADTALWLYGTGMVKGAKCLKPAWEPIILARNGAPADGLKVDALKADVPKWPTNVFIDDAVAALLDEEYSKVRPARIFYIAKPTVKEKEMGLEEFPNVDMKVFAKTLQRRNTHPTVKPIALMRALTRLLSPAGGTVLDPFCGSGTTGIGAVLEDCNFVGIEREENFAKIAEARIEYWGREKIVEGKNPCAG